MQKSIPRISISIPTYNNAILLNRTLCSIENQQNIDWEAVEIVVSDNASTDNTAEVVAKFTGKNKSFKYHRNSVNIGMIKNFGRAASLAQAEFVWMLGSDDLMSEGALSLILEALPIHDELDLIYFNHFVYSAKLEDLDSFRVEDFKSKKVKINQERQTGVYTIKELTDLRIDPFTAIYSFIMRRKDWLQAISSVNPSRHLFDSAENCVPHAFYIANNLLERKAFYIDKPLVLASTDISWVEFVPLYLTNYLPKLHRVLLAKGASRKSYDQLRTELLATVNDNNFLEQVLKNDKLIRRFQIWQGYSYFGGTNHYNLFLVKASFRKCWVSLKNYLKKGLFAKAN